MSKGTATVAIALAFGVALSVPVIAVAGDRVGDIEVSVQPLASMDNVGGSSFGVSHGYIEYRVRLKNSSTDDRLVHLAYPPTGNGQSVAGVVATRTVRVAGGQEAAVSLYQQPPYAFYNSMLEVRVDGVPDSRFLTLPSVHEYRYDNVWPPAVLASRGVPQEFRDRMHPTAPSGSTTPTVAILRSEVPTSQWSPNWLGYSCYDAILVTAQEAEEMPPQVQTAVRQFVECGGTLLIHGPEVPAAFRQGGEPSDDGVWTIGFGAAVASGKQGEAGWNAIGKRLAASPPHVYRPEAKPSDALNLLIAEMTVPVRGLFILILFFGACIGPVNIWVLSRYKRRIWLWWSVPALSLLTCLVVFTYSLASEGITGRGKTATMTLLDERCHRAATIGYVSYYCPLTPWGGARFGVNTDVALLADNVGPSRRYGHYSVYPSTDVRRVDWTVDQQLVSGWVNARVPTYFQVRKNENRRERLPIERQPDGSLKVVNALGSSIEWLQVVDRSGRIFEGRDIPAGAERSLAEVHRKKAAYSPDKLNLRQLFTSGNWLGQFTRLRAVGVSTERVALPPGGYMAILTKSPFIESPVASVDSEHTVAIVVGISKEETPE